MREWGARVKAMRRLHLGSARAVTVAARKPASPPDMHHVRWDLTLTRKPSSSWHLPPRGGFGPGNQQQEGKQRGCPWALMSPPTVRDLSWLYVLEARGLRVSPERRAFQAITGCCLPSPPRSPELCSFFSGKQSTSAAPRSASPGKTNK